MRYIIFKMKKRSGFWLICIVVPFIFAGTPVFAADESDFPVLQSIGIFHDNLWLGNSDKDSAPSPILSVWGVSLSFGLTDRWSVAPELGLTTVEYLYRDGVALPAEIEEANAAKTLTLLLGIPFLYRFQPADSVSVFVGTGPAFSFKIPYKTFGDISGGDVAGYFIKSGRFFHWEVCTAVELDFFEHLGFYVRARVIVPLYRLWDGDNMPLYDGLFAGVSFGLRLKF